MPTNEPSTTTISLDLTRRLRDVGTGAIWHLYPMTICPTNPAHGNSTMTSGRARRESDCPACKVLVEADAAIARAEDLAAQDPTPPLILKRGGLLTVAELAALALCDPKTVYNHAKAGRVTAAGDGARKRFTPIVARTYLHFAGVSVPPWLDALAGA